PRSPRGRIATTGPAGQTPILRGFHPAGSRRHARHFAVHRRGRLDLLQGLAAAGNGKNLIDQSGVLLLDGALKPGRKRLVNESQIFIDALKLADPAERAAFLGAACAGNPEGRAAVEALLRVQASNPNFLEQPAASLAETPHAAPETATTAPGNAERAEMVLAGRYKLLEEIGEGGMGTVWMAQQTEPVKRLVAVKLIKAGMDSKAVLARFEAERQALALMDHPNIAKVHDAGTTETGRPFFVMELVRGVPLTKYCDEHRLTPRQRLELFVPVCE